LRGGKVCMRPKPDSGMMKSHDSISSGKLPIKMPAGQVGDNRSRGRCHVIARGAARVAFHAF
jgi:hypothetical protein